MRVSGGIGMDVTVETHEDVAVIIPVGNLVASEINSFNSQVKTLVGNNIRFVLLDMSGITFMDSSGLDAVMTINKHAIGNGGLLVCAALKDNVLKVFRVTWADQKIPVVATRSDALMMIQELKKN